MKGTVVKGVQDINVVTRWYTCSNRLPEEGEYVMIAFSSNGKAAIKGACQFKDGVFVTYGKNIYKTHEILWWCPLKEMAGAIQDHMWLYKLEKHG